MRSNRFRLGTLTVPIAAALLVLGGCGGDESSGSETDGAADAGDGSRHSAGNAKHSDAKCVGDDSGAISLKSTDPTKLPGGSDAAVDSVDLDAEPPAASLELGDATRIERDNATGLAVGDQFGLQRGVYKVVGICQDAVTLDEF